MRRRATAAPALLWLLVPAAIGCGPSFRRTEQSDNAFLRCFDMDYHPGRTADEKETCWRRWLDRHVYNQPDDKVAYAELRIEEVGGGISVPGPPGPPGAFHHRPVPAMDAAEEAEEDEEVIVEPDLDLWDRNADGGQPADVAPSPPPGIRCEKACRHSFEICAMRCAEDESARCREACEAGHLACVESCSE